MTAIRISGGPLIHGWRRNGGGRIDRWQTNRDYTGGGDLAAPDAGSHTRRDRFQIPNDAKQRQHPQSVIRYVDLPPEKSLPGRGGIVVMIVVPAFTERQQRQQPVVAAAVIGAVALP